MQKILALVCSFVLLSASVPAYNCYAEGEQVGYTQYKNYDVDLDGSVTVRDIYNLQVCLLGLGGDYFEVAPDVNKDSKVNIIDFIELRAFLMNIMMPGQIRETIDDVSEYRDYGSFECTLDEEEKKDCLYNCELIGCTTALNSFMRHYSTDAVDTDLFNEEFFEHYYLVIALTDTKIDDNFYESSEAVDNTLCMNYNDPCEGSSDNRIYYSLHVFKISDFKDKAINSVKYRYNKKTQDESVSLPVAKTEYGSIYGTLNDEKSKQYENKSILFESSEQLQDFISESDSTNFAVMSLAAKYTEEFFENQSVVICFTGSIIDEDYFESATVNDNTLYIDVFDTDHYEPLPRINYLALTFDKSVLKTVNIKDVKYQPDVAQIPDDQFEINCEPVYYRHDIDEWVDSPDRIKEIIEDSFTGSETLLEKYDTDFFENNVVLAFEGQFKTNSVMSYYDEEFFAVRLYGDYVEGTNYLTLMSVPKKYYEGRKTLVLSTYDNVAYKPAIYLYPEEETEVSVNVNLKGDFTCVYPEFTDVQNRTWKVTAQPDGTLYSPDGSEYSYLFWEGTQCADWDMSKGFVVKGSDTLAFFRKQLPLMGLTPKEYNDFIVYWLPQMQNNKYNYITFQTDSYTDNAVLNVTPQPDSVLRVFMAYEAVSQEEAENIKAVTDEPEFDSFSRDGFTVVEWGGTQIIR